MHARALIFQYLLIAPRALLAVVLIALLRRDYYRKFPIFTAYIIQELVQSIFMITLIESSSLTKSKYLVAYSVAFSISTAFRFGVVHEIFVNLFRDYNLLGRFGRPLLGWSVVVLLSLALGLTAYSGAYSSELLFVVRLLDRIASILQCGLLVGLFALYSQLGLTWKSQIFGITLGLGIYASINLAVAAIRSEAGFNSSTALDYFSMAVYHACVLIWIFYLFAPEHSYAPAAMPQHDLESWNLELERLLKR